MKGENTVLSRVIGAAYAAQKRLFPPSAQVFPRQIDIEVTNACNLDCVICPRATMTRPIGNMEMGLFEKIIGEVSLFGLEHMDLSLFGEPLINPYLFDMARLAKDKGRVRHLYTSTNGLLLDQAKSRRLLECGFDKVIISVDGATKETYEKIRKKGNYEELIVKIRELLEIKKRIKGPKPYLVLQIIRMNETEEEVGSFVSFWRGLLEDEDIIQIKPYLTWAGKVTDRQIAQTPEGVNIRVPCLVYLWRNLAIYHNGDVTTCCYDSNAQMVLGNVKDTPLRVIWGSPKLENIRRRHLEREFSDFPLCESCPFTRRRMVARDILRLAKNHHSSVSKTTPPVIQ